LFTSVVVSAQVPLHIVHAASMVLASVVLASLPGASVANASMLAPSARNASVLPASPRPASALPASTRAPSAMSAASMPPSSPVEVVGLVQPITPHTLTNTKAHRACCMTRPPRAMVREAHGARIPPSLEPEHGLTDARARRWGCANDSRRDGPS
jgi:hypothetical protein